jgi:hypothetical protein
MTFVWVTRIRNAAADTDISDATRTGAYVLSAACLLGAAALAWVGWKGGPLVFARAVAAAHAVVWVVRGVQIATAGHSVGFVVVHEVLAVISILLSVWVWRASASRLGDRAAVLSS